MPYPMQDIPNSGNKALPCLSSQCIEGFLPHDVMRSASTEEAWEYYQVKMVCLMTLKQEEAPEQATCTIKTATSFHLVLG
jgi:hypothetical protein